MPHVLCTATSWWHQMPCSFIETNNILLCSPLKREKRPANTWFFAEIICYIIFGPPSLLTVLDLPTFKPSPQHEVPSRLHTVWCGIPIRYDDLFSIILNICLSSCLSAQDNGLVYLRVVRFTCLAIASVTCVNDSFTLDGEFGSESQLGWEEAPTLSRTHNTMGHA